MKKKRNFLKRVLAMLTAVLILCSSNVVFAASDTTHNFNEINELEAKYSYGTLFWTDESEVMITSNNTASYYTYASNQSIYLGAKENEVIEARITKCAVDEDGDMCDVITTISNITVFVNEANSNMLGTHYNVDTAKTSREDTIRVELTIGTLYKSLINFWFTTNAASGTFDMKYVKTGTNNKANINGASATIYDIDVQTTDKNGDLWLGNEGFTLNGADGEVYYQKGNWCIDTDIDKGVRVPDYSAGNANRVENNNRPELYSTAVATEQFDDAVYTLFYSGWSCGIGYVFASPYTFALDEPSIAVDKERVYENEQFNYTISQYVPNNYWATYLNFITAYNYSSFQITDTLNSNLSVTGNITISNENDEDVTSYFNIRNNDNEITAVLKDEYLSSQDFYSHLYRVNVPVEFNSGAGQNVESADNSASTTIVSNDKTISKETNVVTTALKYDVSVNAQIDNGKISINNESESNIVSNKTVVNHSSNISNTVTFKAAEGYGISSVVADGKELPASQLAENNGVYTYTLSDENIKNNIEHNVVVNTVLKDSSVLVNYIDESGNALADSVVIEGKVFDSYTTAEKSIYGYELISVPDNASGVFSENQIIVNYVYALKDTSVTAKYIDADTNTSLSNDITIKGKVFDEYNTEEKAFYGYSLVSVPSNASGTMTEDNIEVIYYYTRNAAKIIANYIDENSNTLADSITIAGQVGDSYTTQQKTIYGYELVRTEGEPTGEMPDGTTTVNYIYRLKDTSVLVNYLDDNGKKLAESITIDGKVFEKYAASAKSFSGYSLTAVPENATGTMTEEQIVVNYVYTLKESSVVINYIDEEGNQIADTITKTGKVFDEYTSSAKEIYGYELISVPENANGKMAEETIIVNYIYKLKESKVNVIYADENGNNLADPLTITGKVFDEYDTETKAFHGYYLIAVPENANGTMTEETITVKYVYRLKDSTVIVNYTDENANILSDSITIEGRVFDSYSTEAKSFYGYELTEEPSNASGVMSENTIIVNYIYRLKDTSVTTNYLTVNGDSLSDSVIQNGKVFDKYDTESKDFYGYFLTEIPDNAQGEMTEEAITVDYIYSLKDAQVIIHFVDRSGKVLSDSLTMYGKVFEKYETAAQEISGYNLVEVPENATGEMAENTIEVTYVYDLKDASVIARYLDESSNELAESVIINGQIFDHYETKAKEIEYYYLIDTPDNAQGEMTEEPITVDYIYRLKDTTVLVKYVDENGKELTDSMTIDGRIFDEYQTEAKEIEGYSLISTPENATGTMTENTIEVIYIYKENKEPIAEEPVIEEPEITEPVTENPVVTEPKKENTAVTSPKTGSDNSLLIVSTGAGLSGAICILLFALLAKRRSNNKE